MNIAVAPGNSVRSMILPPRPGVSPKTYWFYITGLTYSLFLGKNIPTSFRKVCAIHSDAIVINSAVTKCVYEDAKTRLTTLNLSPIDGMLKEIAKLRATNPNIKM